jgi:hypothetical protein
MNLLILLVKESVLGSSGARSQVGVIVLGDVFVHLLRGCRAGALDGLGDVVDSVLATTVRNGNKEDKESLVWYMLTLIVSIVVLIRVKLDGKLLEYL